MAQYGFFFDQSRCYDCKACAIQCKSWNSLEPGPEKWLRVFSWEEGTYPNLRLKALFAPCYHCSHPSCIEACTEGAIFKEDEFGAVLVDGDLCNGCRTCWEACPYGSMSFTDVDGSVCMSKCTMCIDRLVEGLQPACVLSCPLRALDFGPLDEIKSKYGDISQIDTMPDASVTLPSLVIKPAAQRSQILPYDEARALELLAGRGDLEPLFEDTSELTEVFEGLVGRDALIMKPRDDEELMRLTQNDEG